MRACLSILLVAGFVVADDKPDDEAKGALQRDLKALIGKWEVTSLETSEGAASKDEARAEFVIKGDGRASLVRKDHTAQLSYVIDTSRAPKAITLTYSEGPLKGAKQFGIYKLEDDKLVFCLAAPREVEEERPKKFATAGKGVVLLGLKRRGG